MKIYISAPLKQRKQLKAFTDATHQLKEEGHDVIDVYENEKYPIKENTEYFMNLFRKAEKSIRNSDVVILDVTYPSNRGGYEMARALDEKKVVIAMSSSEVDVPKAATVAGNLGRNYKNLVYNNKNVGELLEKALHEAKDRLDTKFILIISPEIDRYLEWASDYKRMHKAQIVRNAVEKEMEDDKDYQKYMKEYNNK